MIPISRRSLLSGATVALGTSLEAQAQGQPSRRPNVLVIVLDDLGCHDLGFLGATDLKTPNIDALANHGVRFRNWYSNAPVCAPSRAAILSGRYPAKAGVATNGARMTPGLPTLGSLFQAAGYRTAAIGKWHLGDDVATCPNGHGFESFYGFHSGCVDFYSHRFYWGEPRRPNYHDLWRNRTEIFEDGRYLTERIAEEAVAFISKPSAGKPFCAYVAFNAPHYPMHAPAKYMDRFKDLPLERRTYAAMIAAVDDGIGAITQALRASGQFDNTILFFVGDNGATTEKRAGLNDQYATAGDNGVFRGFKFSLFDGGIHVPGFLHWPARFGPQGKLLEGFAQSMDILPTALAAAGIPKPEGMDGASLLPLIEQGHAAHQALYWHQNGQTAIRQGKWKLVLNGRLHDRRPDGGQPLKGDDAVWLSNLEEDPGESRNLRKQHPNVADELATLAAKWMATLPLQQENK